MKVSVIIPAYNSAHLITRTLESVFAQTYKDYEVIVIDDGSSDNTEEVLTPYRDRIRYLKQKNAGVSAARNHGLSIAQGEFLAFLDADDIWLPMKLEKQMEVFAHFPEVGVCATHYDLIDPNDNVRPLESSGYFLGNPLPGLVTGKLSIPLSSGVIRKKVYETIGGFDEKITSLSEDYDFWIRASTTSVFCKLEEKLLWYRSGHANATSVIADKRRDIVLYYIIPRFLDEYGGSKYVKWYHVWQRHSLEYFERGCESKATARKLYWLVRSLLCNPKNRDALGCLFRVFFPKRTTKDV